MGAYVLLVVSLMGAIYIRKVLKVLWYDNVRERLNFLNLQKYMLFKKNQYLGLKSV